MHSSERPISRSRDIVVQNFEQETLIYDLIENKAHCLNQISSFVWNRCDGELSVDDIRALALAEFGSFVSTDLVKLAILQLTERDLMEFSGADASVPVDRRAMIKKIGLATAVALPVVSSLIAPVNGFAIASNCACTSPLQCSRTACPSVTRCNNLGLCAP